MVRHRRSLVSLLFHLHLYPPDRMLYSRYIYEIAIHCDLHIKSYIVYYIVCILPSTGGIYFPNTLFRQQSILPVVTPSRPLRARHLKSTSRLTDETTRTKWPIQISVQMPTSNADNTAPPAQDKHASGSLAISPSSSKRTNSAILRIWSSYRVVASHSARQDTPLSFCIVRQTRSITSSRLCRRTPPTITTTTCPPGSKRPTRIRISTASALSPVPPSQTTTTDISVSQTTRHGQSQKPAGSTVSTDQVPFFFLFFFCVLCLPRWFYKTMPIAFRARSSRRNCSGHNAFPHCVPYYQ